ncbi:MAG: hypothetical protein ABSF44_03790 [Candidatus Bathyarchaeia archaeon]
MIVIVAVAVLCLSPLIALGLFTNTQKTNHGIYSTRFSGDGESFQTSAAVDPALSRYLNLTAVGKSGAGGPGYSWNIVTGNVTWIGSTQDPVKSLQNIHLFVYTRVDENSSMSPKTFMLYIGIHVEVNQTEPTIPSDAIDHKEIIIPTLGLEMPNYSYSFNCSTYVA